MGAKRPSDRPSIMPIPPNVPVQRPIGDIGVGGGPGIPPRFPKRGRRRSSFPKPGAGGRGFRQPPPGYKYDEIDRLVPIDTPSIGEKSPRQPDVNLDFYNKQSSPLYDGRGNVIGFKDGSKGTTKMFDKPIPREEYKGPGHSMGQPTPRPKYDPNKPSAVMETERVNVQDPTLGGPPEREVPIPKERDTSPRGRAPFSPDERAMARDAFFEKMFSRADERKQSRAMDQEERRNVMDARRDEAAMRDSERGMRDERGGRRGRRGKVFSGGMRRRGRRRDFTRRRSQMEGRRSRDERAAFRDRFVSTLRGGFFS